MLSHVDKGFLMFQVPSLGYTDSLTGHFNSLAAASSSLGGSKMPSAPRKKTRMRQPRGIEKKRGNESLTNLDEILRMN